MNRLLAAAFAALLLAPTVVSAEQAPERTVLLPAGTPVGVHVLGGISSGNAKAGDEVTLEAANDVDVDGYVVVRKGAEGHGTIRKVDQAGGNGHSGALELTFDWIYAVDGGKLHLSQSPQQQAEEDRKGASSTASLIGFATFGIGGLFGHNLARGREIKIDERKTLSSFVGETVHVRSRETAQVDRFDR